MCARLATGVFGSSPIEQHKWNNVIHRITQGTSYDPSRKTKK